MRRADRGRVPGYCYRAGDCRADGDALCRLHRKGMMAIAEIIHKKWVEPILADNYNRGRVEGRVEGVSDADQEWEAWLTRREIAVANGEPFDEPPPSRRR